MSDLVSILIPAYNAEKWIGETIQAALNQTWHKKEIIIVDDGSTDNTLRIAKEFESSSVKVVAQQNHGTSFARNKALSYAQGDYIQWLDADDLLAPDKIAHQLNSSSKGCDSKTLLSSPFGKFYYRYSNAKFIPTSLWQDLSPIEWLLRKFTENVWMNPATWIVSRRLTILAGPWDERLSFDDDGEYFVRVVSVSENVHFVQNAKTFYRVGNIGSLSWDRSNKALESLFLSTALCIQHLRAIEDTERVRNACLAYLNHMFRYYYPERMQLIEKCNAFARELGGSISLPKESWLFKVIRNCLGWQTAKYLKKVHWKIVTSVLKKWDKCLYDFVRRGKL
jgi:glycosyltransferase involved in cell wall biosynthesis